MALRPDLLAMLACPVCKQELIYDAAAATLTCQACRLRFKVEQVAGDDIPNMLVDKAEKF